jgi:YfiH family protein
MLSFSFLQEAGLRLAAMSGKEEGDCGSHAEENAARFLASLGVTGMPRRLRQVHGTRVVTAECVGNEPVEGDGLFTNRPGVILGITVADCAPLLLFDPVLRAICLLHAGREGSFHNIAQAGVQTLVQHFGSDPSTLIAEIGPCAHACCYEVSEPMALSWREAGYPCTGRHLDIPGTNRLQLEKAGVFRHNIHIVPHCTMCGGVFFSYRTDKTSNRNLVVMML